MKVCVICEELIENNQQCTQVKTSGKLTFWAHSSCIEQSQADAAGKEEQQTFEFTEAPPLIPQLYKDALKVIKDRAQSYGDMDRSFSRIAQCWSAIVGWPITKERAALMLIMFKVLREDANHSRDNLIDLVGYTECLRSLMGEE